MQLGMPFLTVSTQVGYGLQGWGLKIHIHVRIYCIRINWDISCSKYWNWVPDFQAIELDQNLKIEYKASFND